VQGLTLLLGSAAAAQLLNAAGLKVALAYQAKPDSHKSDGLVFQQAQMQMLHDICAIIIPKTETLGAAEIDTHGLIDHLLKYVFVESKQAEVKALLAKLDLISKARFSAPFIALNQTQQVTLLTELDAAIQHEFDEADGKQFKFLKGLVVFGYYTSEVGASQELKYVAVPGGFKGSIPYDSVGCAWGAAPFYFFEF